MVLLKLAAPSRLKVGRWRKPRSPGCNRGGPTCSAASAFIGRSANHCQQAASQQAIHLASTNRGPFKQTWLFLPRRPRGMPQLSGCRIPNPSRLRIHIRIHYLRGTCAHCFVSALILDQVLLAGTRRAANRNVSAKRTKLLRDPPRIRESGANSPSALNTVEGVHLVVIPCDQISCS
jgi:hypothetical protein